MHTHTGKALFKYALTAKRTFILALVMLAIGVAAELAGPFIARSMIDDHMLAIEQPFYETTAKDDLTVDYDGRTFKRGDRFAEGESKGAEVRVLQVGRSFVFVDAAVPDVSGDRSFADGVLTLTGKDGVRSEYPA
ncbi:MAG: multidrug ABC transporter permease, partial [Paenibacillaceae bacterium]|nr:multidrug ABC transporter permease [Paenibacillaceae bacterium]